MREAGLRPQLQNWSAQQKKCRLENGGKFLEEGARIAATRFTLALASSLVGRLKSLSVSLSLLVTISFDFFAYNIGSDEHSVVF